MHYVLPDPFSMGLRVSGNKGTRLRAGHVLVIDNVEDVVNTLEIHIFNVHIQILHPATTSYTNLRNLRNEKFQRKWLICGELVLNLPA